MRHFFFTASRAEDLPDYWVAHCLDLDVVAQGSSLGHALTMLAEALEIVLEESDWRHRRAPEDDWKRLFFIQQYGVRGLVADFTESATRNAELTLAGHVRATEDSPVSALISPVAWALAPTAGR